jgi:hypothetical protein
MSGEAEEIGVVATEGEGVAAVVSVEALFKWTVV